MQIYLAKLNKNSVNRCYDNLLWRLQGYIDNCWIKVQRDRSYCLWTKILSFCKVKHIKSYCLWRKRESSKEKKLQVKNIGLINGEKGLMKNMMHSNAYVTYSM
eukprot:540795_1